MKKSNLRILMVTWGPFDVASSRVRAYQFVPYLEQYGWECRVLPSNPIPFNLLIQRFNHGRKYLKKMSKLYSAYVKIYNAWIQRRICDLILQSDVVFIQKVLLNEKIIDYLERSGKLIVFDFDDALYSLQKQCQSFNTMLSLADIVITTNHESLQYAKKFCSNSVRIIGPIDTDRYCPKEPEFDIDEVVIGWIGSPYTITELESILDSILHILNERPNVKLHIIGANNIPTNHVGMSLFPWRFESELKLISKFDIGIMPLKDTNWNRGKGGYKLLQYMSYGIPSVASPIGINVELIGQTEAGFFASTATEWQESLIKLIDSSSLRLQMGRKARKKAVTQYSLEVGALKLIALIESII